MTHLSLLQEHLGSCFCHLGFVSTFTEKHFHEACHLIQSLFLLVVGFVFFKITPLSCKCIGMESGKQALTEENNFILLLNLIELSRSSSSNEHLLCARNRRMKAELFALGYLIATRVDSFMKGQQGHAVTRAIKYCYLYKRTRTGTSIRGHLDTMIFR